MKVNVDADQTVDSLASFINQTVKKNQEKQLSCLLIIYFKVTNAEGGLLDLARELERLFRAYQQQLEYNNNNEYVVCRIEFLCLLVVVVVFLNDFLT